jgi:NAD(P)-dependent dehydrogenase (short-subunit alcohol dehydrogenase family)
MPTVLITGANRGLGLEFARQYAADGWRVHATCRSPGRADALDRIAGDVVVHRLDVTDEGSIAALARALGDAAIDVLVNNAGVYGRGQSLGRIDYAGWEGVLRTNVLAPVAVTEALLPALQRAARPRVALISSCMGSIADNTSGGTYAYRSSKAALNAAGRCLALDLKDHGVIVLMLHPGWVRTDMGGAGARLEPRESIAGLRRIIDGAGMRQSGGFYAYDGSEVPW